MWPDWLGDIPWRTIGAFAAGLAGGGLVAVAVRRARGEGSSSVPSAPDRAEDAPVERSPRPSGEMVVRETPGASPGRRLLPWLGGEASTPESLIYGSAIALLLFVVVAAVTALVSMTLPSSFPLFGPVVSALLGVHVLALRDADCRRDAACASEPAAAQAPSQAPRLREGAGERPGAPQPAAEASGPSAPTGEVSPEAEALFAEVSTALDAGGDLRTEYLPRLQAIEADHSAPARARATSAALSARVLFEASEAREGPEEKKHCLTQAVDKARGAIGIDERYFGGHKWLAIALGSLGSHQGFREKIGNALVIRDAARRAKELEPGDMGTRHTLGQWYWNIAGLSWVERRTVSAVLGAGLEASYEDALAEFEAAEEASDGNWPANTEMVNKCRAKLGRSASWRA